MVSLSNRRGDRISRRSCCQGWKTRRKQRKHVALGRGLSCCSCGGIYEWCFFQINGPDPVFRLSKPRLPYPYPYPYPSFRKYQAVVARVSSATVHFNISSCTLATVQAEHRTVGSLQRLWGVVLRYHVILLTCAGKSNRMENHIPTP